MIAKVVCRLRWWWYKRVGWSRICGGFCPACDSSPPDPDCSVCEGDGRYHWDADTEKRMKWWRRYKSAFE